MAITAANVTYLGSFGPTQTGESLATVLAGNEAKTLHGTVTFTGDAGASTSATINFIDGTKTLNFTPSAILATRNGGTAAAGVFAKSIAIVSAATATLTLSAELGSGSTGTFALKIIK